MTATRRRWRSSAPARRGSCSPTCSPPAASTASCSSSASREYVEHRVRAGVLEQPDGRAAAQPRAGRATRSRGTRPPRHPARASTARRHRIDFAELTGRSITVYGQQEVVKDLIAARLAAGGQIVFEARDVTRSTASTPSGPRSATARRRRARAARATSSPAATARTACAAAADPDRAHDDRAHLPVRLAGHPRRGRADAGRAGLRPPRARLRPVQHALAGGHPAVPPGGARRGHSPTGPDDRIWAELPPASPTDDGFVLDTGPIIEQGITGDAQLRRRRRCGTAACYLAGDAAHIVPPTGAKGMNLAIADCNVMAAAIDESRHGRPSGSPSTGRRVCAGSGAPSTSRAG